MVLREIVIDAHESRRVVIEPLVRRQGRGEREPESLDEIQKPGDGIRIGAKPLECEWIGRKEREQRIGATGECQRSECEQLVLYDGSAGAQVDLVLCVLLAEGGVSIVDEL